MTAPSRVLVADDHAPTREDVRAAVEADPRFTVVALAADAADAIQAALRERPDVALLDMRMPGSGAAAAWEITARLPATRAVMLTVSRSDEDLFAALRAGASGYLLKDMPFDSIADELAGVLEGRVAMPPELVARLVEEFRDSAPRRRALLGQGSRRAAHEPRVAGARLPAPGAGHQRDRAPPVRLSRDGAKPRRGGPAQAPGPGPRRGDRAVRGALQGALSELAQRHLLGPRAQ